MSKSPILVQASMFQKRAVKFFFLCVALLVSMASYAQDDNIELETTRIKANKELPQILYVVPWKDIDSGKGAEQKLVLHDFFGDLYDPVLPSHSQKAMETTVYMDE